MSKVDKEIIQKSIRRVLIDFGELSLSEIAKKLRLMLPQYPITLEFTEKYLDMIPDINCKNINTGKKITIGKFTKKGLIFQKEDWIVGKYYFKHLQKSN